MLHALLKIDAYIDSYSHRYYRIALCTEKPRDLWPHINSFLFPSDKSCVARTDCDCRCRSDMGTPAKWAPPDPKSLVKQSSQRPHFASDLRTLQRYGDVYYAHCAVAYLQGGGASSASTCIVNNFKFQPLSFDLAFDNKRSKYICSGCC